MARVEKIKKLREKTELPVMACKKALDQTEGDVEKAEELLREKKSEIAAGKKGRAAEEGVVASYIHNNRRVGVLLDLRCETDFVARSDGFQELAHLLAMQVAAMAPLYVEEKDIPKDYLEKRKKEWISSFKEQDKPEQVIEEIVEGKLEKLKKEMSLLDQPFIKEDEKTVRELIDGYVAEFGENIIVERFKRYEI